MSSFSPVRLRAVVIPAAIALGLAFGLGPSSTAKEDNYYFSLKKIFPNRKCSPVIPNYELLIAGFDGGEFTKFKIHDDQGRVIEVITTFVSRNRNQWAMVGSKTKSKVIFCLYASGVGKGSVDRQSINSD